MTKRYKLLKRYENPCKTVREGTIKTEEDWISVFSNLQKGDCEIKTDWFQEIKEPEKIEVKNFYYSEISGLSAYRLITSNVIPQEKLPAIKQAIEDCLNDVHLKGVDESFGKEDKKWKDAYIKKVCETTSEPPLYTQQQMDEAIEKAFYAGRSWHEHRTFQDYLSSLKNNPL
jgi:hypothetical protein